MKHPKSEFPYLTKERREKLNQIVNDSFSQNIKTKMDCYFALKNYCLENMILLNRKQRNYCLERLAQKVNEAQKKAQKKNLKTFFVISRDFGNPSITITKILSRSSKSAWKMVEDEIQTNMSQDWLLKEPEAKELLNKIKEALL